MIRRFYLLYYLAFSFCLFQTSLHAQVSLTTINTPYTQDFNTLAASGTTNDLSTLPSGWLMLESGTNANTSYAAGTGSSNTGNTYSFGLTAADRAFGGLQSGSLIPTIGAYFVNNTGTIINALQINYWGEQWRLGASGRGADRLDFQYSTDATSLNTGTWINADSLDFNSPVTVGTVGALIGNDNHRQRSFTISGLSIPAGATFYIRWLDFNVTSSDDGLGVDDFSLTPVGTPPNQPSITLAPSALNFGDVNINTTDTLSYRVTAANLTNPISVSVSDSLFSLSLDGTSYSHSLTVNDSTRRIIVRFTPITDGTVIDSIIHISGTVRKRLAVTGNGFNQVEHIIPIASARALPVGTKVTVAGRVTVGLELGNPASVQDSTGGIPVFDYTLAHAVQIGDSVIVTGPIGVFSNQKQISGSGIFFTKPNVPQRIIQPKQIQISELAANEGLLVTVQNVSLVNKSFVFYPQSTEKITDSSIQADLRIDGDTNLPGLTKPQTSVNITGIVGRFNTNAQLLPRFAADVPGAVAPTTPVDSIPKSKTFDVVNWNFEFFGARSQDYKGQEFGPADEQLQLNNIRQVLLSLQPDVVAVEEVSNDSTFSVLVSQLPGYRASCSNRYSYSFNGPDNTFPYQKVCFIYDTTNVKILSARPMFEQRYDSARTINPSLLPGCPGGAQSFYSSGRLPYWVTANISVEGVTEQISFAVLHAKSGSTESDRQRRLYDGTVLKDSLDAHFSSSKFIVLGDLNDDLDQSIVTGAASPYQNYVNDTARYIPITRALSDAGARSTVSFQDMIDHQVLSNELKEEYLAGSATVITPFTLIPNYATTTSDHLPVLSRFRFKAPVASFTGDHFALSEDSVSHTIVIQFSKPLSQPKQLSVAISGSASYGSDFTTTPAASGGVLQLSLPAGATSASFTFNVINDTADELTEAAVFTLQSAVGLDVGSPGSFTITIDDNDVPTLSFAQTLYTVTEGNDLTVTLALSTPPATDQTATLLVANGPQVRYNQDYTTSPEVAQNKIQLSIPAGSTEASFSLTALDDGKREVLQAITFFLSQASSGLKLKNPRFSVVNIKDAKKKPHFTVSPNPTTGTIRIHSDECESDDVLSVQLRSMSGEVLFSGTGTLHSLNEALSHKLRHERTGIYILSIQRDDDSTEIRIMKI